ncbi:MAG: DNA-binding protein [Chlamydiia bacterium]
MAKVTTRKYKHYLLDQLQDPAESAAYLNAALQDDDPHVCLLALRDIAEAQGGLTQGFSAGTTSPFREFERQSPL